MFRSIPGGVIAVTTGAATDGRTYQHAPQGDHDIGNVPPSPVPVVKPTVKPTGDALLLARTADDPGIEERATPQLCPAGLRIDPTAKGPAWSSWGLGLPLMTVPDPSVPLLLPHESLR